MRIPDHDATYAVTKRWVDECLVGDGSLLVPDRQVWTQENLAALKQWFVDEPDLDGERTFEEKLVDQADGASEEQRLLFAEIRTMQLWPMREVSGATKQQEVRGLLAALQLDIELPTDVVEGTGFGFAIYGMAKVHKYWHLCLLIERALTLKERAPSARRDLVDDPRAWKRFVRGSEIKRVGTLENMLLHMVCPDDFEPIASTTDKAKIVKAFAERSAVATDVDDALAAIHTALNDDRGEYVWLYDDETRAVWDPSSVTAPPHPDEAEWRQSWADHVVSAYRDRGGALTEVDPGTRGRVGSLLDALGESADVDVFLDGSRQLNGIRNYWSGPHSLALKAAVTRAEDPESTARLLSDALRAPETDDEAGERLAMLSDLRGRTSGGVRADALAAAVWHWQDPSIAPWTAAEANVLGARGWWDRPEDDATAYFSHQEVLASFAAPINWLVAALDALDRPDVGLLCLPPVNLDRCSAVAAGDDADLVPVVADLTSLAQNLAMAKGSDSVTTARSVTDGPDVWVEIRDGGHPVLRLWASVAGLAIVRPSRGEASPSDLAWMQRGDDGDIETSQTKTEWSGVLLDREAAADTDTVLAAAETVMVRPPALQSLDEALAAFRGQLDPDELETAEQDRRELEAGLTPAALQQPDLDLLRQVINTGRYGGPGPMSTLNTSLTEADAENRLDAIGAVITDLCHGKDNVATRIDRALEAGIRGLGESVTMKLLAITHPDRILPAFPYKGQKGKQKLLDTLGLERPNSSETRGNRQIHANDDLLRVTSPLTTNLWEAAQFLYWLDKRAAGNQSGGDDEDHLATVADSCHVDRDWVDEVVELLDDRGQIVMYGPPGTGKTFVAMQLAAALAPNDERRHLVQFHPAYGYEDFIEGLRPRVSEDGLLTYELVPGPLKTIAAQAAADPQHRYVLIIDEINRANLPKVFGELLFLLEYRDQEITTMYGGDAFQLPANLSIIATMNTADRSIALVDAALRRRFHFVPMFPDRHPVSGTLESWLARNGEDDRIARLVDHANEQLRVRLGGPHLQIGPSHFMRPGISRTLQRVWRYSIEPLIEEQLYGDDESIAALRWEAMERLMLRVPTATDPSPDQAGVDGDDVESAE